MSSPKVKLITTEDGSHSLLREDLNETYHSTKGAAGESQYVFIEQGLSHYYNKTHSKKMNILEVGFGTGLNALLTLGFATQLDLQIEYLGIEPWPVQPLITKDLNYGNNQKEKDWLHALHSTRWEEPADITDQFTLHKVKETLEAFFINKSYHIIYFDAFAPSKQPELWSMDNLRKCFNLLRTGGVLTTYCAQGQFKRNLHEVGFEVETLPGALGKKEMVRAIKH